MGLLCTRELEDCRLENCKMEGRRMEGCKKGHCKKVGCRKVNYRLVDCKLEKDGHKLEPRSWTWVDHIETYLVGSHCIGVLVLRSLVLAACSYHATWMDNTHRCIPVGDIHVRCGDHAPPSGSSSCRLCVRC